MKAFLKKYLPILIGKRLALIFFFNPQKAIQQAYLLFSTPRKGKALENQQYFLEAAEDDVLTIDTNYIQTYRWAHTGETILLVHGWDSNTHRWKTLIEKLHALGYNIVAFDAPAQGNSTGKTLNVPLYASCLQQVVALYRPNHIIGHSVGGMTTIFHQYKYKNPEIQKLVILAPPAELAKIMDDYQEKLKLSDRFMEALDNFFYQKFGYYFEDFSMITFAKDIQNPALLIHDLHDTVAPHSGSEAISKAWEKSKFITTENFGHSLFFDEVDDMIIDFLRN